jgi:hypothetical protein
VDKERSTFDLRELRKIRDELAKRVFLRLERADPTSYLDPDWETLDEGDKEYYRHAVDEILADKESALTLLANYY